MTLSRNISWPVKDRLWSVPAFLKKETMLLFLAFRCLLCMTMSDKMMMEIESTIINAMVKCDMASTLDVMMEAVDAPVDIVVD